jgi:hypothetical protein
MTDFIKVTRVYVQLGVNGEGSTEVADEVKTQPILLSKKAVASARPSNRLGKDVHRSTITLINGQAIDLQETYTDLSAMLV